MGLCEVFLVVHSDVVKVVPTDGEVLLQSSSVLNLGISLLERGEGNGKLS